MKKVLIIILIFLISLLSVWGGFAFYKHKQNSENQKTVGVLVIVLGRYNVFWKGLYKSSKKYFLPSCKKHYFVFTDDMKLPYRNNPDVTIIPHKKLPWPYGTMLRYDFFLSQKEILKKYDYLFFLNLNLKFKKVVGEEVLPDAEHDNLAVVWHHRLYEENPRSTAYIPPEKRKALVAGGFNGGTSEAFLKLSEECSKNIHTDLQNNIIAIFHDETHLNKYIMDKNPLVLPVEYLYPAPFKDIKLFEKPGIRRKNIKIVVLNKIDYGGYFWLRGHLDIRNTLFNKMKYKLLHKFARTKEDKKKYSDILYMFYFGR